MNKRGSSQQFLKNKKQILEELINNQQDRIQIEVDKTPILKLGNVKPEGLVLEFKMREMQ